MRLLLAIVSIWLINVGAEETCECCGGDNGCGGNLKLGDGDCDSHSDCAGDLQCGHDNCADFRDLTGDFDATDDCCYLPETCSCCGGNGGCGGNLKLGDGDCDSDDDCEGDLRCGSNNCGDFRSTKDWTSSSSGFDLTDDCCYQPETIEAYVESQPEEESSAADVADVPGLVLPGSGSGSSSNTQTSNWDVPQLNFESSDPTGAFRKDFEGSGDDGDRRRKM